MPNVVCVVCSKPFYAKQNALLKGLGKYCSTECFHLSQKNGRVFSCHSCSRSVYRTQKDQRKSHSKKFFCSKTCQTKWRNIKYSGSNHSNWTGGESVYRDILRRSGQDVLCRKCCSTDTRILAVHHKDKNRKNNEVPNLVWLCHNCHFLVHHYADEAKGFILNAQD